MAESSRHPGLTRVLTLLENLLYSDRTPLDRWRMRSGDDPSWGKPGIDERLWKRTALPRTLGTPDQVVWFRTSAPCPHAPPDGMVVLVVDCTDSLLFVDGIPRQGIDVNHREVRLTPPGRAGGWQLALQVYSGRAPTRPAFRSAFLATLRPPVRGLIQRLRLLMELETRDDSAGNAQRIQRILDLSSTLERDPDNALRMLQAVLESPSPPPMDRQRIHLLPHSHIDVVWLWTLAETRRKIGRTFSSVLRIMEEYPEASFSQSQAALYAMADESYPALMKQVRARVREGRWHPVGSTWVEPDCNIPNGESLVRQIFYGKRYFREHFGVETDTLWLPDTFGYSWALPQILSKSGVRYFCTTKLTWNDTNRFPHSAFWWQGPDGSRVLTYLTPVGLEGSLSQAHLRRSAGAHANGPASHVALQTFGFGDGGGGPTREDFETVRALASFPDLPDVQLSTLDRFFHEIGQSGDDLPVWSDEIYLELHRGTYTTHGWIKRANRRAECRLFTAELLAALAWITGGSTYPIRTIEAAWKELLLNQFHDIVPGTAIADAYKDAARGFETIESACAEVRTAALSKITSRKTSKQGTPLLIFNPLPWSREELIPFRLESRARLPLVTDSRGQPVAVQVMARRRSIVDLVACPPTLPGLGFTDLVLHPDSEGPPPESPLHVSEDGIDNGIVALAFASDGRITSLLDRRSDREYLDASPGGIRLQTFRDTPLLWDAWDIDPRYDQQELTLFRCTAKTVLHRGPLVATVESLFESASGSSIRLGVSLRAGSPLVTVRIAARWREDRVFLKIAFPFTIQADHGTYEIQFGHIRRPVQARTPVEKAKYEVPGQQWVDIADDRGGMSVLNDGIYGYDTLRGFLRLSLIRSPHYPHPVEPWHLTDSQPTDQGEHFFTIQLLPHGGDWRTARTPEQARNLNTPPLLIPFRTSKRGSRPLVLWEGDGLLVDAIKKAEDSDDLVLRCHEAYGMERTVTIKPGFSFTRARKADLLERPIEDCPIAGEGVSIAVKPHEIVTLLLTPKRSTRLPHGTQHPKRP